MCCPFACPSLCPRSVQEYLWEASHYLVRQVFNGIKEMFSATRDIQVRRLSPLPFLLRWSTQRQTRGARSSVGRAASAGPWPREDPPVPAQGCGAVPGAGPGSPVCAGLSRSAAGGRACRCWEGAGSAAACTNSSLFLPLFPPPKHWLTESAKLIAQSGQTVEWVTPMGLPIVQPYYRVRSTVVSVWWQSCIPSPVPLPRGGSGEGAAGLGAAS